MRKPVLVATALVLSLAGCTSVGVVGYPVEYIDMHAPGHIWVTQTDKTVTELFGPQVRGDTLVGFEKGTGQYVEIPVSNVQLMRAPLLSPMKTALFAGTIAIGGALLLTQVTGTNGAANVCFPPGGANMGLPVPCPKPA
jgi:hypothetical protein